MSGEDLALPPRDEEQERFLPQSCTAETQGVALPSGARTGEGDERFGLTGKVVSQMYPKAAPSFALKEMRGQAMGKTEFHDDEHRSHHN